MQTIRMSFSLQRPSNRSYFNGNMQPTGPIETTECDFETMESVTETLYDELYSLVDTPFFKFFRVCVLASFRAV